jgi:hypothetical protein
MPTPLIEKCPVVIGGIGGSGTRLIAQILLELNYFLGNDLNESLDYLGYTLIFKRKKWFYRNFKNIREIENGLMILEKSFQHNDSLSLRENFFLIRATISMALFGHNQYGNGRGKWAIDRARNIMKQMKSPVNNEQAWAWKEPNAFLLITEMNIFFKNFKYIHVIRHGFDVSTGVNQQQLFNWGPFFGVGLPSVKEKIPEASFKYWVRANKAAIEKGKMLGSEKFYLLNYDQLCLHPKPEIAKLIQFLGIEIDSKTFDKIVCIPYIPDSAGRFKRSPVFRYDSEDYKFLIELGFSS